MKRDERPNAMRLDFCRIDPRSMAPLIVATVTFATLAVCAELPAQEVPAHILHTRRFRITDYKGGGNHSHTR